MPSPRTPRARALESLRVLVGALTRSARAVEQRTGITNAQLFASVTKSSSQSIYRAQVVATDGGNACPISRSGWLTWSI